MNELIKILFAPLIQALSKYYRQTITGIMIILIFWLIDSNRQDTKDNNDGCKEDLKEARKEISELNKILLQNVLNDKELKNQTAKNDSIVRKQSAQDIKQVMP
ncbi:hypothetical protein [uncultured Sphingobacterium sp.]|uniref:hypothetical protein n=1 Tax=Sphingobacterium sp. HSC-15S19 TaxID=2910971 RepID=UPI0025DE5777|nr:hypothetical protein [uncultured Sphingobacterium sp.]